MNSREVASDLASLICDAYLAVTGADVAFVHPALIRFDWKWGDPKVPWEVGKTEQLNMYTYYQTLPWELEMYKVSGIKWAEFVALVKGLRCNTKNWFYTICSKTIQVNVPKCLDFPTCAGFDQELITVTTGQKPAELSIGSNSFLLVNGGDAFRAIYNNEANSGIRAKI